MSLTHIHLLLYACQGSIWKAFWVPAALPHWTKSLQRVFHACGIQRMHREPAAAILGRIGLTRRSLYVGIHLLATPKMNRHTAPAVTDTQSLWDMQQRTHCSLG